MASQRKSHVFRVTGLSRALPDGDLEAALQEALDDNSTDDEKSQIKAEIKYTGAIFRWGCLGLYELRVDPFGDWQIEMGDNDIDFDCHFFGFTQLYVPDENEPVVAE
ncbi:hypothetical protein N7522_009860 [Penicillium canescens]|nr:hypothetical protein N7522_009860 [Penicillium canescens]KAJ6045850.1 hypothetical protein N7444_007104 [Penicillium canescens]